MECWRRIAESNDNVPAPGCDTFQDSAALILEDDACPDEGLPASDDVHYGRRTHPQDPPVMLWRSNSRLTGTLC